MAKFGNWQDFLDETGENVKKTNVFETFKKMYKEVDLIQFTRHEPQLRQCQWVDEFFSKIKLNEESGKSSLTSWQYRNTGNNMFVKHENQQALDNYNKCILFAPHVEAGATPDDKGTELALGLANRSAVLFHLQSYQAAIQDIDMCLQHGYPARLTHKVLHRKALCLIKIGQLEQAKLVLQELKDHLEHSTVDTAQKDKILEDVQTALDQSAETEAKPSDKESRTPELYHGPDSVVLQATSAVKLCNQQPRGRHLIAREQITAGSVLIVEKPYAAVLLPTHYHSHCHHCFTKLTAPVPCKQCTEVQYCSQVCRDESWKIYHRTECPFMDLFHSTGVAHLSMRVVLTAGLQPLLDFKQSLSFVDRDRMPGVTEEGCYDNNYLAVYALMPHITNLQTEDLLQYTLTAGLLLRCLEESGYFPTPENISKTPADAASSDVDQQMEKLTLLEQAKNEEIKSYIGGLLLRHICQLVCNAHAITELEVEQASPESLVDTQSQVRVATAIYPTASLMNHACDPNIIPSFHGNTLIVRAVRDIPEGAEVFNCYGPHCKRMKLQDRQEALRDQYFFHCACEACKKDRLSEEIFQALKCPKCKGALVLPESMSFDQMFATCLDCGFRLAQGLEEKLMEVLNAQKLFSKGVEALEMENYKECIPCLEKCLKLRLKLLYKHNKGLADVLDALARAHSAKGNYSASAELLQRSTAITEAVYGETSVELANDLQKYAEVLFNAQRVKECLEVIDRSIKIFTLNYGEDCPAVSELSEMRDALGGESLKKE